MGAQSVFDRLVSRFGEEEGVEVPKRAGARGFGSSALTVDGSIFAMVSQDRIVLKLPAPRVAELIAAGAGAAFDAGKGRPMREWVALGIGDADPPDDTLALALAAEAFDFVRGGRRVRH